MNYKFKFGDRVKINSGFYEGQVGKVIKARENFIIFSDPVINFLVKFDDEDLGEGWIREDILDKLEL